MDSVMTFGFLSGFFTLVLLGYRRQLRTRLPVIPIALGCCTVYGFLQGAWPLGFCLIAITVSELRDWRVAGDMTRRRPWELDSDRPVRLPESESRISRMFGAI